MRWKCSLRCEDCTSFVLQHHPRTCVEAAFKAEVQVSSGKTEEDGLIKPATGEDKHGLEQSACFFTAVIQKPWNISEIKSLAVNEMYYYYY